MSNGVGLRNAKSTVVATALSGHTQSRDPTQVFTRDLDALFAPSDLVMMELTKKIAAGERHLTITQKQLESLKQVNASLRTDLTRVLTEAAAAIHLAYHDALTGLPNRRLLLDRLNQAIAQASRQKKRVALVFFDVDGFKAINDRFGHANGDVLLQCVASRLSGCLRAADTACRYGGDEFIVLLPEVEGEQSAAAVEQKIRAQLAAPYAVDGAMLTVTLSIGTALYPDDARNDRELIRLADAAMYHSKNKKGTDKSIGSVVRLSAN